MRFEKPNYKSEAHARRVDATRASRTDVVLIKEIITKNAMIINYTAFTTNLLIEILRLKLRSVVNK